VHATFDPAKATITIPVPLATIKAKPGSKIGFGASLFGGAIYSAPAALVTFNAFPADDLIVKKVFVVPKK
jgi:hypothetical protein